MNFRDNLLQIMESRNLKQADICKMTGIQTSLMSDYISGKKSPALSNALAIAENLGITLDELVGRTSSGKTKPSTSQTEVFSSEEIELIKKYRSLDKSGKKSVNILINGLYSDDEKIEAKKYKEEDLQTDAG